MTRKNNKSLLCMLNWLITIARSKKGDNYKVISDIRDLRVKVFIHKCDQ